MIGQSLWIRDCGQVGLLGSSQMSSQFVAAGPVETLGGLEATALPCKPGHMFTLTNKPLLAHTAHYLLSTCCAMRTPRSWRYDLTFLASFRINRVACNPYSCDCMKCMQTHVTRRSRASFGRLYLRNFSNTLHVSGSTWCRLPSE